MKKMMSDRKISEFLKIIEIINWGRRNPVTFVEQVLGVPLLDFQRYVFMKSWNTPYCVWCMGRSSGKTTLAVPFLMAKAMLIPGFEGYILGATGEHSKNAFLKLERIAKGQIPSFQAVKDIFLNETVKSVANSDGFTHNPVGYKVELYNGACIRTVSGDADNIRGKRSNCNFYDEAGYIGPIYLDASEPFTVTSSDFVMNDNPDIDTTLLPKGFKNQRIYASSASSTDTRFFQYYKDFSLRMMSGDKNYFVADISSDLVLKATFNGVLYPKPLLTKSEIDKEMEINKEKALREYKNIFTSEGGSGQMISRACLIRNSTIKPPTLVNDGQRKFLIAYDPAAKFDQSVVIVAELLYNENIGYNLDICNVISFIDVEKKKKTPMRLPEQMLALKQLVLDYNGKGMADYENIEKLLIDAGSGGGGVGIADDLMEPWYDQRGNKHRGLIDNVYHEEYLSRFPNNVNKIKMMIPNGQNRTRMFDALVTMSDLDLISYPAPYDGKGYLNIIVEKEDKEKNKSIKEKEDKELDVITTMRDLSSDEELALINIDLAKEEMINMYKYDSTNGNYRYGLTTEKTGRLYDDKACCMAMLAFYLQELRHNQAMDKPIAKDDMSKYIFSIGSTSINNSKQNLNIFKSNMSQRRR